MVKYIILSEDLHDEDGGILFYSGEQYRVIDQYVMHPGGFGILMTDIWVDYRVQVDYSYVH